MASVVGGIASQEAVKVTVVGCYGCLDDLLSGGTLKNAIASVRFFCLTASTAQGLGFAATARRLTPSNQTRPNPTPPDPTPATFVCAQAITRQYTPLDNTIVYNGLAGVIGRYEL